MTDFFAVIIIGVLCSLPILGIIIAIRAIMKKPLKKLAIATAICATSIIPLIILGVLTDPSTWCKHEYVITKEVEATCTSKGEIHKHCTLCEKDIIEKVNILPHQWFELEIVESTCTSEGYTTEKCIECAVTQKINIIKEFGHSMEETYRLEPTLSTDGKVVNKCSRCGHEETNVLPSFEEAGKNAPKKTDDGIIKYVLSDDKTYYTVNGVVDKSVATINIPNTYYNVPVKSIGKEAFKYCKFISIVIPDNITSIEESAFESCSNLTEIIIPQGIHTVSAHAFAYCSSLENVSLPNNLTNIGEFAFIGCKNLASIAIPKTVTNIGSSAFSDCKALKSLFITDIVAWCGISFGGYHSNPLEYASNLYINEEFVKEIVIPEGVASIGAYAFSGFSNLAGIVIPKSINSIGYEAFKDCISLKNVYITDLTAWCNISIDGYDASPLNNADNLNVNGEPLKDLIIPNDVTKISKYTFYGYTALNSVTFHNRVTEIGACAFAHCTSLTSIRLPDSLTTIGRYAFYNCNKLDSFFMGQGVTSIGDYAFDKCFLIETITYNGTVEQWNLIIKDLWYGYSVRRFIISCVDGTIAKNGEVTYN